MSLRKKAEEICKILATRGMDVEVKETSNGIGVTLRNPSYEGEYAVAPIIYVSEEGDVDAEADLIASALNKAMESAPTVDMVAAISELLTNWEKAKDNVILRLIHPVGNLPADVVTFEAPEGVDPAIKTVATLRFEQGCSNVTKRTLEKWGVSEAQLYKQALENTTSNTVVRSMIDILQEMMPGFEAPIDAPTEDMMYVVTNNDKNYGSAILLAPQELRRVLKPVFKDEDVYIIPSSVHELIVCKGSQGDPEILRNMINDVNTSQVEERDLLGSSPFKLSGDNLQVA